MAVFNEDRVTFRARAFDGGPDSNYPWAAFRARLEGSFTDTTRESEKKRLFFLHLTGSALQYLDANPHLYEKNFDQILTEFEKRFNKTQADAQYELKTLHQRHDEKVLDFSNRVKTIFNCTRPRPPSKTVVVKNEDGVEEERPDPQYEANYSYWRGKLEGHLEGQTSTFIFGLRSDLLNALPRVSFETWSDALDAAIQAELKLLASSNPSLSAATAPPAAAAVLPNPPPHDAHLVAAVAKIEAVVEKLAHLTAPKGPSTVPTNPDYHGRQQSRPPRSRRCYECGSPEHLAHSCPIRTQRMAQERFKQQQEVANLVSAALAQQQAAADARRLDRRGRSPSAGSGGGSQHGSRNNSRDRGQARNLRFSLPKN